MGMERIMKGTIYAVVKLLFYGICVLLAINILLNLFDNKSSVYSNHVKTELKTYDRNYTKNFSNCSNPMTNPSTNRNISRWLSALALRHNENKYKDNNSQFVLPVCTKPVYYGYSPFVPNITIIPLDDVDIELSAWLTLGGSYQPHNCRPRDHVAILVPFRDRYAHLSVFLRNIHPFLMKQHIHYRLFIIEQSNGQLFNRAALMNIGFLEAMKIYPWDCFIFHDVDLLPLDNRNLYTCPRQPRHMSVAVDVFGYRLPYNTIFGGVSAMSKKHFVQVNGFSNSFFGWGGEDDDMSNRIKKSHLYIGRYPINIARYTMLKHAKEIANPKRYENLANGINKWQEDGLNSIKYNVYSRKLYYAYTWYLVKLNFSDKILN